MARILAGIRPGSRKRQVAVVSWFVLDLGCVLALVSVLLVGYFADGDTVLFLGCLLVPPLVLGIAAARCSATVNNGTLRVVNPFRSFEIDLARVDSYALQKFSNRYHAYIAAVRVDRRWRSVVALDPETVVELAAKYGWTTGSWRWRLNYIRWFPVGIACVLGVLRALLLAVGSLG